MQFSGASLRAILAEQVDAIDVRDWNGGPVMVRVPVARVVRGIDLDQYVGIGNNRRIRYIRPLGGAMHVSDYGNGSRTTTRIRINRTAISPPLVREFKAQPVRPQTAVEVSPDPPAFRTWRGEELNRWDGSRRRDPKVHINFGGAHNPHTKDIPGRRARMTAEEARVSMQADTLRRRAGKTIDEWKDLTPPERHALLQRQAEA